MTLPPSGFVKKPKPKSVAEAVNQSSHDRLKTLAKSALHSYIASFLDTSGVNRSLITATSPAGLTFVTDKSLQDSKDPLYRPTQLARMYNEIREKLPSILIIDAGFHWIPSGLGGGLERASNVGGKWQGYYRVTGQVPVTVAVVSGDQETTDMLQNILLLLFDPLRNISGGSRLYSGKSEDSWEVRLPLTFEVGTNTPENYEGDPKGQTWSATIDVVLDVEDQIAIEMDMATASIGGFNVNNQNFSTDNAPSIIAPDTVRLQDGAFTIQITGFDPRIHRVVLDDPSVASLDLDTGQVFPRRTGSFNIKLIDQGQRDGVQANPQAPFLYKVVATALIGVTY